MRSAISIFGTDRPGIIAFITKCMVQHGANIQDASMTILQGHFAMILVIECNDDAFGSLRSELTNSEELQGFTLSFSDEITDDKSEQVSDETAKYVVHLAAGDTPGIVAKVTEVLGKYNANIVDCSTRINSATNIFSMIFDVEIPVGKQDRIDSEFKEVASQIQGDISFQRVDEIDL